MEFEFTKKAFFLWGICKGTPLSLSGTTPLKFQSLLELVKHWVLHFKWSAALPFTEIGCESKYNPYKSFAHV